MVGPSPVPFLAAFSHDRLATFYVDQSRLRNCSPSPLNHIQDDGWLNIDHAIGWESKCVCIYIYIYNSVSISHSLWGPHT